MMLNRTVRIGIVITLTLDLLLLWASSATAQTGAEAPISPTDKPAPEMAETPGLEPYAVGVDDILEISVLQPEPLTAVVTVGPDGSISFPYIGTVLVKGMSSFEIQEEIQKRLADGYLRYPVVNVALKESHSRRFFVYGEVIKPGAYPLEQQTTVLRAISIAGGFTKFGSSSRVKVLRPRVKQAGYEPLPLNIKALMEGGAEEDVLLQPGDIVVVSEGMF